MRKIIVSSLQEGVTKAKNILYEKIDRNTILFLSGGKSPRPLYEALAKEKIVHPAAVAMVDERYGEPFHNNSNEKMLRETGLLSYFQKANIPFHPILQKGLSRESTAKQYDQTIRKLLSQIPKSLAVVSIGPDGHTAGIAPNRKDFRNPLFHSSSRHAELVSASSTEIPKRVRDDNSYDRKSLLVSEFNDPTGPFGERITLTFEALAMIDYFILWVFGEEKKEALQKLFAKESLEEVPGRFYRQKNISKKTILITDQDV